MNTFQVRVLRRERQGQGIDSFEFGRVDGGPLPPFTAGSHIDVHVPNGVVRQYSLCNDPSDTHRYRIAVLCDPASRGGSVGMHGQVNEGDLITISEPRNLFTLEHAPHTLLLAGGIGITPLLCMAKRLATADASFELHYCSRSIARTAFLKEVTVFGSRTRLHLDDGDAAQKLDLPTVLAAQPPSTRLYVCGPTGFIDFVVQTAEARGWPAELIHLEYFGGPPRDTSGNREFKVRLASSGKTYTIPADKSVTSALHEQGIDIQVSCEQGVCGTCLTRVLHGVCDHRDLYLTEDEKAENSQFMPCCSRSKSQVLVLDL